MAPLSTADGASAVIVFRAPKVSKKCIVRANESEQECELRREGNRQSQVMISTHASIWSGHSVSKLMPFSLHG